jgi:hypothetical protein
MTARRALPMGRSCAIAPLEHAGARYRRPSPSVPAMMPRKISRLRSLCAKSRPTIFRSSYMRSRRGTSHAASLGLSQALYPAVRVDDLPKPHAAIALMPESQIVGSRHLSLSLADFSSQSIAPLFLPPLCRHLQWAPTFLRQAYCRGIIPLRRKLRSHPSAPSGFTKSNMTATELSCATAT